MYIRNIYKVYTIKMAQKSIIFRVDESLKLQFEAVCKAMDITPSQVFRQVMKQQIEAYGLEAAQGDLLKAPRRKK